MSISLYLCPQRKLLSWNLGRTCLATEKDGWAYAVRASELRKPMADARFEFYHDTGCKDTTAGLSGEPVTWMTAQELLSIPFVTPAPDNEPITLLPLTKAAIGYLKALPPDAPVVLVFD